jgi:UDP-N-acetylmuramate dehydrogenase
MTARNWIDEADAALAGMARGEEARRLGLQRDVSLGERTYIGVGGRAPILLAPRDSEILARALARLAAVGVRWEVLGAGSNLLVADAGPSFVVVATEHLAGEPVVAGDTVRAGAGYPVPRLVQRLQKAGLTGLEFAEGIPGSVGGAVRMNAGWHEGEFGSTVASLETVTRAGTIQTIAAEAGTFAYRRSPGLGDRIVTSALLTLRPDDPARVAERMRAYRDHRVRTQPVGERNAGCMFRNPAGDHAGRLIDACGLKGRAIGRVMVSPVHANFFINQGGATCRDVMALIDLVRDTVSRMSGVTLESEVVTWT